MGLDRLAWCSANGGGKAKDGIQSGVDGGNKLYVIRANHEGNTIPGKLHMTHSCAYIPYGGQEIGVQDYEVLCGPQSAVSWVDCSGTNIPHNAIHGGQESSGETLYIGRVIHNGTVTVGKVHPSHGTCYVPYGGEELGFADYEILVRNKLGQHLGC